MVSIILALAAKATLCNHITTFSYYSVIHFHLFTVSFLYSVLLWFHLLPVFHFKHYTGKHAAHLCFTELFGFFWTLSIV
jgi:hypothetical protein